ASNVLKKTDSITVIFLNNKYYIHYKFNKLSQMKVWTHIKNRETLILQHFTVFLLNNLFMFK
ncbi:hypothetical protein ABEZ86_00020, partial [Micromonospora provocatoris]